MKVFALFQDWDDTDADDYTMWLTPIYWPDTCCNDMFVLYMGL